MVRITTAVKHLIILNVLFFVATELLPLDLRLHLSTYYPTSSGFMPHQIITHMFMHGDLQHLVFNMLGLFFLGPYVERSLGIKRFIFLYLSSGLAAVLLHYGISMIEVINLQGQIPADFLEAIQHEGFSKYIKGYNYTDPVAANYNAILSTKLLGASGCVYGVLAAFATMFPDVKLMLLFPPIPIKAKYLALGLIGFGIISGVGGFSPGIAHYAHVGGALCGAAMIFYWGMVKLR